jgi:hypothetical protein
MVGADSVYHRFPVGFETTELRTAKALLDAIAQERIGRMAGETL